MKANYIITSTTKKSSMLKNYLNKKNSVSKYENF